MDFDRNSMTVPVQSSDYTNKFLQKDSNPTTMEVVTQTNAVKSPTDSPATTKLVYTVEEIARMLAISLRSAYNLCNSTTESVSYTHLTRNAVQHCICQLLCRDRWVLHILPLGQFIEHLLGHFLAHG